MYFVNTSGPYASWNKWLALLIVASTALDYLLALGMDAAPSQGLRKLLLLPASVAFAVLGLLCAYAGRRRRRVNVFAN